MDGVDVLKELCARGMAVPVVMVTGIGDKELAVQVLQLGAVDYVPKTATTSSSCRQCCGGRSTITRRTIDGLPDAAASDACCMSSTTRPTSI